jgi:hypothetical protein
MTLRATDQSWEGDPSSVALAACLPGATRLLTHDDVVDVRPYLDPRMLGGRLHCKGNLRDSLPGPLMWGR